MDKAPEAFLTIGEMADRLGVKTHILRYWEEQFPMLNPLKRAGGRRLYRPDDVRLLHQIDDLLHKQGYTIRGARDVLKGKGAQAPVLQSPLSAPHTATNMIDNTGLIQNLKTIRARLASALEAA